MTSPIDEIKERLDIVEFIGGYIPLHKAGRTYKALCPFHAEKTPSFVVYPDQGRWHCYGACNTGGDIITFVQKKENLDFRSALEQLARRAGVDLERYGRPEQVERLNRLREALHLAAEFYHHHLLHTSAGASAHAYLRSRGLGDAIIAAFQLGYAPDAWDAVLVHLQSRGFSQEDLETAGLVVRRDDGGVHDRFRRRIMIPIRDLQGRVIGFGGRILGEGEPKYLNSPQTPLFDKSAVVFGLDRARPAIQAANQVVLVEGYMDVISAHQAGYGNVVATMGTAITAEHLKRLSRYTRTFIFALDADVAGIGATVRSLQMARAALAVREPVLTAEGQVRFETRLPVVLKIATLPPGQDPDDILRHDPAAWAQIIAAAEPLLDFYFAVALRRADRSTAHGKAQLVAELLPAVSEIEDPIERRHYIGRLATLVGVTEREIDRELERLSRHRQSVRPPKTPEPTPSPASPVASSAEAATERVRTGPIAFSETTDRTALHLLAHLLSRPDLLPWLDRELAAMQFDPVNSEDFTDAAHRALFDAWQEFLYSGNAAPPEAFRNALDPTLHPLLLTVQALGGGLASLREEQRRKDLVDTLLRLRRHRLRAYCRDLELLIRSAERADDERLLLGNRLVAATQQQKAIERALQARSHTGRWLQAKQRHSW
jgi:DNA primase